MLLLISLLWLRLVNLGYSDYQGDEIKALFLPAEGQSLVDFLLSQRKGPTQFIITYLMGILDPSFQNQFLIRLPFAAAFVLASGFFYFFVKNHFGKKIALYATFFFSFNGVFVALSRIAQYQSFVILFYVLALYFFTLAALKPGWRIAGLYLGVMFWAFSMLSHYDGIFIAPFVFYLLWKWYKSYPAKKTWPKWRHLFLSGCIIVLILGAFYLPFFQNVAEDTVAYWLNRLSGGDNLISSSIVTFKLYNPKIVFYLYVGLFVIYLAGSAIILASASQNPSPGARDAYQLRFKSLFVLIWFLFPWVYMEILVNVPGTHIYTYLTPLTTLISIGLLTVESLIKRAAGGRYGTFLYTAGVVLLFLFMFYQSHKVFVDHTREYPWESERFLFWTLVEPDLAYHLPIFGFPYNRNWEQIGDYVASSNSSDHYYSNEKDTISRFYIPFEHDVDQSGPFVRASNVQYIYQGQLEPKAEWWADQHEPDRVFSSCDYGDFAWGEDLLYVFAPIDGGCARQRVMAEVFFMTPGNLEEILAND
ncbi:MAG: glycosyltransferase family 39 protein [Candidatus Promineifilaceae bacterium]|nr:glycosyltransferase family 39 protein [Candidatus Promineifilaceae bacterium]